MRIENVYHSAVLEIPRGQTRSFMELAAMAGRPGAARAAGRAFRSLTGSRLPWHRVVGADGRPTGSKTSERDRARGALQLRRLRNEGARPKQGEDLRSWARRVGAQSVGHYPSRELAASSDEAILRWSAEQIEPIFDEAVAIARGFVLRGHPRRRAATLPSRGTFNTGPPSDERTIQERIDALDWAHIHDSLGRRGYAHLRSLLSTSECGALMAASSEADRYSRSVDMEPRGFGVGSYHYYREPLPEPAFELREQLYTRLVPVVRELWPRRRYPGSLESFWQQCRAQGQRRSSSILICYGRGGINHPHRDVYGRLWFPFQAFCMLSKKGTDFKGGDLFLLDETGGRKTEDIAVTAGDVAIFATRERIQEGRRVPLRHGMKLVTRGKRYGIGIVFHLAD